MKVILILIVIIIILVLIIFYNRREGLEKKKGCCVGCTTCKVYTEKAEQIMNEEDRSTPFEGIGTIVDMRCYSQDIRNYTDTHYTPDNKEIPGCGKFCAKSGIPVGILSNGEPGSPVYTLLTQAPSLAEYMGKTVKVTGRLMKDSMGLFTIKIELLENGESKPIEIRTPM